MIKVGIPKEIRAEESRVAMHPQAIGSLIALGVDVIVQSGAGKRAGLSNEAFEKAGAHIQRDPQALWQQCDVILKVHTPIRDTSQNIDEIAALRKDQICIGLLNPLGNPQQIQTLASTNAKLFALDLLPRTSRAQAMDALSSQANLMGYASVLLAARELPKIFPMLMTAAGTVGPANVLVVGAGVAGL